MKSFAYLIQNLWDKCNDKFGSWLISGFEKTGIYPVDSKAIPDSEFNIGTNIKDWNRLTSDPEFEKFLKEIENESENSSEKFFIDKLFNKLSDKSNTSQTVIVRSMLFSRVKLVKIISIENYISKLKQKGVNEVLLMATISPKRF